ncbi:MAG: permease-like cell division protein FtsX, partial [Betaproteobacteria bacterium]
MNWIGQHRLALGLILGRLVRAPFSGLLTMIVIGAALSLPLGLYTLVENVRVLGGNVKMEPQVTVFLAPGASTDSVRQIEARLKETRAIRQFRFIPRDQAMQELLKSTGLADVAAGLDKNPLPDAFVIEPQNLDPAELEHLRSDLVKLPKVDFVQFDAAWAKRLNAMLRLGRDIALLLAALLGFALVAVISNTIRLQILSQRDEIEISKLIGATDAFIRLPFLYHGALQGLSGGLAAWLIVSAGLHFLNPSVDDLAQLYAAHFLLQAPDIGAITVLLLASSLLG